MTLFHAQLVLIKNNGVLSKKTHAKDVHSVNIVQRVPLYHLIAKMGSSVHLEVLLNLPVQEAFIVMKTLVSKKLSAQLTLIVLVVPHYHVNVQTDIYALVVLKPLNIARTATSWTHDHPPTEE